MGIESRNEAAVKDVFMIALRNPQGNLIGSYEKHESRQRFEGDPYDQLK